MCAKANILHIRVHVCIQAHTRARTHIHKHTHTEILPSHTLWKNNGMISKCCLIRGISKCTWTHNLNMRKGMAR